MKKIPNAEKVYIFMVPFFYAPCYNKFAVKYQKFVVWAICNRKEAMGRDEFYIEKPRENTAFSGMEFFLQSTPPNAVATHAHIHDSIELLYAKSGRFTVFLDGREYLFSAGDLILFCSNSIHHISSGDGAEHQYYVIKVDPTLLLELAGTMQGTAYLMRFSEGGSERRCYWSAESLEGSPILQALRALIAEYASEHYARELAMKLHAAELLLAILRDGGERREAGIERAGDEITGRIYASLIYVRSHFSEDLDVRSVAERLGISYSYFSRSFGRITGKSFKEYLTSLRMTKAYNMLLSSDMPVSEVALACGYENFSYFIAEFKKVYHITPNQLRKQMQGQ